MERRLAAVVLAVVILLAASASWWYHGRGGVGQAAATTPAAGAAATSTTTGAPAQTTTQAPAQAAQQYRVVVDLAGREVRVPVRVERVVAVGPGALRLIVYLNASDKVVGIEECEKRWGPVGRPYIMAHPELLDLPVIGPGGPGVRLPDLEAVVKVKPDVIFMTYVDAKTADDIQAKTGIPVVVLSYGKHATFSSEPLFKSLMLAGEILGKEERARQVVEFIKSTLEDLEKRTEGAVSPTVYVGGVGYKGMHGIESTEAKWPPFVAVHARSPVDELGTGHLFVDKEQILEWDPDVIFIDEGGLKLVMDDYEENPDFYNSLTAFREGRVYTVLPFNFYATNIGTALADAYFVGKVLYPDRFSDVDPVEKADEIYTFLVGKPVYREMAEKYGGFGRLVIVNGTLTFQPLTFKAEGAGGEAGYDPGSPRLLVDLACVGGSPAAVSLAGFEAASQATAGNGYSDITGFPGGCHAAGEALDGVAEARWWGGRTRVAPGD
ncbi:hypothetical protein JCM10135_00260 [Stetteria hydrogenophila]